MTSSRARRILIPLVTYTFITIGTLVVLDVACMALGLFPPTPRYGDMDLGWWGEEPTGRLGEVSCLDLWTGRGVSYVRNEDAIRTSRSAAAIRADSASSRIAVTGDSQTDLCAPNDQTHAGVLEAELIARGQPAVVLPYGVGRYSPLQAYLAFRRVIKPYAPEALVLNLYTGNDFLDMMRADDRPHFVAVDSGYRIAEPEWFFYDDPRVIRRSRVLFAFRTLADRTGVRSMYLRLKQLRQLVAQQGKGLWAVTDYLRDVRRATEPSLRYPDAFTAQVLNQQLFFLHFGGRDESLRRVRALMQLIRRDNPDLLLVMSPVPSYQLAAQTPVDDALSRTLARLGVSLEEGRRVEEEAYAQLRALATEQGWIFVDNLEALRAYRGSERLFNGADYHLLPAASQIIGRGQAEALLGPLRRASALRRRPA